MLWRKKFFIVRSVCTLLYHQELIHHVRLNQNLYSEFVWSSTAHSYTNQIMAWELNRLNLSTRVLSVSAALDPTNFTLSFNFSFYIFFQKFKLRETFSLGTGGRGGGAEPIYIYIYMHTGFSYIKISCYFILFHLTSVFWMNLPEGEGPQSHQCVVSTRGCVRAWWS